MSYAVKYTSTFYSLDNVKWRIDILTDAVNVAAQIDLDYETPISIEWPETKKTDSVQSSLLTVRAINAKDRQFASLMGTMAKAEVYRNDTLFWRGFMDPFIFEEPYSYAKNYVTEISFSDFGLLKRCEFTLTGRQSINAIVAHILGKADLAALLSSPMISLQHGGQQASLANMYVNTDLFSGNDRAKCLDVLEQVLSPFGMRIIQNAGSVYIYDIERLNAYGTPERIVWKGTDATMGGTDNYGCVSVELEPKADEKVIDGNLEDVDGLLQGDFVHSADHQEGNDVEYNGFWFKKEYPSVPIPITLNSSECLPFRTSPGCDKTEDYGIARRAYCRSRMSWRYIDLLKTDTPLLRENIDWMFRLDSPYIPVIPDSNTFGLRVNLDIIFSLFKNPFGGDKVKRSDSVQTSDWEGLEYLYLPVKIELIDGSGTVTHHYVNSNYLSGYHYPKRFSQRGWETGAASWDDMVLSYYKDDAEETPLNDDWITNRITLNAADSSLPWPDKKREDGEYIPMPPAAGTLRFTVSNGFFNWLDLYHANPYVCWQLYRNPSINIVRNKIINDGIKNDKVKVSDWYSMMHDELTMSPKIGTYHKGMAPSAKCLISDGNGNVYDQFTKNGRTDSLEYLRLIDLERQYDTSVVRIALEGTAQLTTALGPITDASTPGNFIPAMRLLEPRTDSMKMRMVHITQGTDRHYQCAWSNPVCAQIGDFYDYAWSNPVCVQADIPTEDSTNE